MNNFDILNGLFHFKKQNSNLCFNNIIILFLTINYTVCQNFLSIFFCQLSTKCLHQSNFVHLLCFNTCEMVSVNYKRIIQYKIISNNLKISQNILSFKSKVVSTLCRIQVSGILYQNIYLQRNYIDK